MTEPVPPAALLLYDPTFHRRVAGLTLLERAVLALRRGGVEEVVVAVGPKERDLVVARLSEGRLGSSPPEVIVRPGDVTDLLDGRPDGQWLVFTEPLAIDPPFVAGLLDALGSQPPVGPVLVQRGLWVLPAGAIFPAEPPPPWDQAHPGGTAMVVNSAAEARLARRALLAQSIKPLEIDGIVCWLLIRRISVRLSALLLQVPVTPNQVTVLSILLGLVAAVFVAVGFWPWPPIGGALLLGSLIMDNCDGEIARVKLLGSRFGAWLDIYGDFVVNLAFMGGMAVGAYRVFDAPIYLFAGGFALVAFSFYNGTVFRHIHRLGIPDEFLFQWWFDQQADAAGGKAASPAEGSASVSTSNAGPSALGRFLSGLKYLGRRDVFILAYFVTALFGVLHWAFWVTVAGAAVNFVMTFYHVFLWRGLDARA